MKQVQFLVRLLATSCSSHVSKVAALDEAPLLCTYGCMRKWQSDWQLQKIRCGSTQTNLGASMLTVVLEISVINREVWTSGFSHAIQNKVFHP